MRNTRQADGNTQPPLTPSRDSDRAPGKSRISPSSDPSDTPPWPSSRRNKSTRRASGATPLAWLGALLALYLCAPLAASFPHIVSAGWSSVEWQTLIDATGVSAASATLAALIVAVTGVPLGYWLARRPSRFASVVAFVVQLPLALPPLTSGVLLLFLLGPYSLLGEWTNGALTDSFVGILLAGIFVASPFLIVAARSAFAAVDPTFEDVAATLGHRPYARFFSISLPLAWPAIRAGLLLTWLRAFGEFGATIMVAYHPYSLPVYTYVAFGSVGLPAMLPIIVPTLGVSLVAALLVALNAVWKPSRRVRARKQARLSERDVDTPRDGAEDLDAVRSNRTATSTSITRPHDAAGPDVADAADAADATDAAYATNATDATDDALSSAAIAHDPLARGSAAPRSESDATEETSITRPLSLTIDTHIGDFSLKIRWAPRARRLAILGASGSGKSMTLRLLAGLTPVADTGSARILVNGVPIHDLAAEARHIAYVPQDFGLFPHMTVAQQWAYPRDARPETVKTWSKRLGLTHLEDRFPAELSIGQRQRVSIARALSRHCGLILMDEPFSALDTPRRRALRASLRELQHDIRAITVLVTHDPDEAAQLADEILVLDQGRVLQAGETFEIFSRPANPTVASLLGLSNVGVGVLDAQGLLDVGGDVRLPVAWGKLRGLEAGTQVMWRLDPDAIHRVYGNNRGSEGYPALIEDVLLEDGQIRLGVRMGEAVLKLRPRTWRAAPGLTIRLGLDDDALDIWPLA